MKTEKEQILAQLDEQFQQQLVEIETEIESMNVDMSNETKSSAGDKFETSREMINQELDRLENSLSKISRQQRSLLEMKEISTPATIDFGSYVTTNKGNFLFGLAVGKTLTTSSPKTNKQKIICYVLSLNSPIGKAFYGSTLDDQISFMGNTYIIQSIS